MSSVEIFNSGTNLLITLVALIILMLSVWYSSQDIKIGKGIRYLFVGLVLEFIGSWFGYQMNEYYQLGISINILAFLELFILLLSMMFLALSASQLLVSSIPDTPVIGAITVLGLVAIIYFCFIAQDGSMVAYMRQIFPLTGFAYISTSFWSQSGHRFKTGFLIGGFLTAGVTVLLVCRLLGIAPGVLNSMWYVSALVYVGLAVALLMIKVDFMSKKIEDKDVEIEKYNKRIEEIIKSSPFPIIISRLSDDKLILANNNAVKLFGIQSSELDRYRLRDFFADAENRRLLNERLEQEKEVQDFEILVKTSTGDTPFWLLTSANIIDYNYDIALYAAFQDITSRKNRETLLKNQAVRDPLTSLYNRRYFEEEVTKRIALSRMKGGCYSVLMIDADKFKNVNDTYGHKVGDKVLIELVARYGGEEFVCYLSDVGPEKAKIVADRLRETISKLVIYSDEGKPFGFTVSIGISSSEISDNIDTLIKTADEALYRAKENGRNRCEVFTRADLAHFHGGDDASHKPEASQLHPVFEKEGVQEISLLDGIGANHIVENNTNIEERKDAEKAKDDFYPILGLDEEDLK